jgi:uncharacterized surface protein with fasciclin (FAS1) repeats
VLAGSEEAIVPCRVRRATAVAALVLGVGLAGCGQVLPTGPAGPVTTSPDPSLAEPGVTRVADIYGAGCSRIPPAGPGAATSLVDEPVGTAIGNVPDLTTLARAVRAAGLTDTLNDPAASYTVFAPVDRAFDELPAGTLEQMLAEPRAPLVSLVDYHVVAGRYDVRGLADAGTVTTIGGGTLSIRGEPGSLVIDEQQRASVVCGNIPTMNATVFVVDQLLLRP